MNWGAWLFILILLIISDTIAAALCAWRLWYFENGSGGGIRAVRMVMTAVAIRGLMDLVAHTFGFNVNPEPTIAYAVCYWFGRGVLTVALWGFVLFLFGSRTGRRLSDVDKVES